MSYSAENYGNVEPAAPGMYFLRESLDCEELGITVVDVDEEWEGLEHDHAEDGQEEVYLLVDGSARLTVEGEELPLEAGDAVRVDPEATRTLEFDGAGRMVVVGAP